MMLAGLVNLECHADSGGRLLQPFVEDTFMLMLVYKLQIECLQKSGNEIATREARYG